MIFNVTFRYQLTAAPVLTYLHEGTIQVDTEELIEHLKGVPGRHSIYVDNNAGIFDITLTVDAESVIHALSEGSLAMAKPMRQEPESVEVVGSREHWRRLGGDKAAEETMRGLANASRTRLTT